MISAQLTSLSAAHTSGERYCPRARQFFHWYWSVLTKLPTFTAGYICGGIVVGLMMTVPSLAYAAIRLALARIP